MSALEWGTIIFMVLLLLFPACLWTFVYLRYRDRAELNRNHRIAVFTRVAESVGVAVLLVVTIATRSWWTFVALLVLYGITTLVLRRVRQREDRLARSRGLKVG